MNTLKKVAYGYNRLEEYVLIGSLILTVAIIFYQVVMRFIFSASPSWTEEITRYIFIWQIWLGASMALKEGKHIRIELITNWFVRKNKFKAKNILEIFILIVWLAVSFILVKAGIDACGALVAKNAVSAGQRIPLVYVNAALPFSSAIISIRLVVLIILEGKKLITGGAA